MPHTLKPEPIEHQSPFPHPTSKKTLPLMLWWENVKSCHPICEDGTCVNFDLWLFYFWVTVKTTAAEALLRETEKMIYASDTVEQKCCGALFLTFWSRIPCPIDQWVRLRWSHCPCLSCNRVWTKLCIRADNFNGNRWGCTNQTTLAIFHANVSEANVHYVTWNTGQSHISRTLGNGITTHH